MKPRKPLPSTFLRAAELQFANMEGASPNDTSMYACDNIGYASDEAGLGDHFYDTVSREFFKAHFEPNDYDLSWWPDLPDGSHDHESRILALLLCAEMLKRP